MATIVQPYNDWRERAAVNILSPIITGLLNRHFESEDNRKRNALMGQVISDLHATQEQPVSLTAPAMPEGYNANGWASAYHQNENPVAKYDIATTGLVPIQSLQRNPNIQEIQDALIRNMATRRFGGVSPQVAQADMTPYIQAAEQDRRERMRNDVATSYANATDAAGRRDALARGAIQGITPWEAVTQGQRQYEYDNPSLQPYSFNTGSTTEYGGFNPRTGEYTRQGEYFNGLTPSQFAENDYRMKQAAQQSEQFWATFREGQRQFGVNTELQRDQQNMMRDEMNRPKYGQPFAGSDGKMYQLDQYGNTRPFMVGNEHMDAPQGIGKIEWDKADEAFVENERNIIKDLEARKKELEDSRPVFSENEEGQQKALNYHRENIAPLEAEIAHHRDLITQRIASKSTLPTQYGQGVSGAKVKINVKGYEPYKDMVSNSAKKYGIEPELIRALIQVESNWNPKAVSKAGAKGLGQFMDSTAKGLGITDPFDPEQSIIGIAKHLSQLLQKYNGDIEKALWAYNAGSGRVKDNIMPAETRAYIPKVMGIYNALRSERRTSDISTAQQPAVPSAQGNTPATLQPAQAQAMVSPAQPKANSQIMWRNPNNSEDVVTEQEYATMKKAALDGQLSWAKSPEDVDQFLEQKYTRVEGSSDTGNDNNISSIAATMNNSALDWRPSYQKTNMSPALTASNVNHTPLLALEPDNSSNTPAPDSAEVTNHATNADIQAGVDKLNGDDTAQLPPLDYYYRYGIYPAGFLGSGQKRRLA